MTKLFWNLCFLTSLSINCISQVSNSFPTVDESDLPGARFEISKTYTGASLFGYINGGAELYLEYGFSGAWVNEISFMGGKYITEIYKMNGPEEAFGIFSVSRFRCNSTPPLSPFTCQTKYQLQISVGTYYISIINSSGNKTDSVASLRIGAAIVSKIREETADIAYYLPDISTETINRKVVLAKGNLGIMNGTPNLADYFGEATGYYAVILETEELTVLSIRFLTAADMHAFGRLHNWNLEKQSDGSEITTGEETITRISENHLLIKVNTAS